MKYDFLLPSGRTLNGKCAIDIRITQSIVPILRGACTVRLVRTSCVSVWRVFNERTKGRKNLCGSLACNFFSLKVFDRHRRSLERAVSKQSARLKGHVENNATESRRWFLSGIANRNSGDRVLRFSRSLFIRVHLFFPRRGAGLCAR